MRIGGRCGGGVGDALKGKECYVSADEKRNKEKKRSVLVHCPDGT